MSKQGLNRLASNARAAHAFAQEVRRLPAKTNYEVPEQDLSIPLDRFPTGPKDGMRNVLR